MKLIIQIPCFNEAITLPSVINDLPKSINGIDVIEYLVIDDGSTDNTVGIAKDCNVHHIISLPRNMGLAAAFKAGLDYSIKNGADIIVNTDGDNQYSGPDIYKLVQPIINGSADIVIGARPIINHPEFGISKKILQLLGSFVLRKISKTNVRDATSGFRAFSKNSCERIFLYSKFSYTLESLIQAGNSGMRVLSVDINVNLKTRDSRLFKNIYEFIGKSGFTILSMFFLYRPTYILMSIALFLFSVSLILGFRFLYFIYFTEVQVLGRTYLPSLILFSVLFITSFLMAGLALLAELNRKQRVLLEEILFILKWRK